LELTFSISNFVRILCKSRIQLVGSMSSTLIEEKVTGDSGVVEASATEHAVNVQRIFETINTHVKSIGDLIQDLTNPIESTDTGEVTLLFDSVNY